MKMFEGGILDKITNDEYEKMYQRIPIAEVASQEDENESKAESTTKTENKKMSTGIRDDHHTTLNLRMLQGSFYLLLFGHILAFIILLGEIECRKNSPLHVADTSKRIFNILKSGTISSYLKIFDWIERLKRF
jgi:hypothetical protein